MRQRRESRRRERPDPSGAGDGGGPDHGAHTLRVYTGTIVGLFGDDVFVDLGAPRMQGVISRRSFAREPQLGEEHEFTLRGQEESLWVLSLREEESLSTWEEMEVGSLVQARMVRTRQGGLEGKVGPLHAFVPKSATGLAREESPARLVGKELVCEVIEVDRERQRCVLSRKAVLRRERERTRGPRLGDLAPGQVVQGRVARIEPFGAFLRFGQGLEGLVHVSNLAWRHVDHPGDVVKLGDVVPARVLSIKARGKRIALGMKQLEESPWQAFARRTGPGALVEGTVVRSKPYGLFVEVLPGVIGLLHRSETGLGGDEPLGRVASLGARVGCRVLSVEPEVERLSLSLLHPGGARVRPEEVEVLEALPDETGPDPGPEPGSRALGGLLRRALERGEDGAHSSSPT